MPTTIEEIQDMNRTISEIGEFVRERTDALTGDFTALREENDRLRADVASLQEQRRARRRSEVARVDDSERGIRVTAGRFAGCSPLDIGVMRSLAYSHRDDPDAPHARSWVTQLGEATRSMVTDLTPDVVDRHFQSIERQAAQRHTCRRRPTECRGAHARATRRCSTAQVIQPHVLAGDARGSHAGRHPGGHGLDDGRGKGDELVPTLERAELWMDVNLQTLVMAASSPTFNDAEPAVRHPDAAGRRQLLSGRRRTPPPPPPRCATAKATLTARRARGPGAVQLLAGRGQRAAVAGRPRYSERRSSATARRRSTISS